MTAQDSDQPLNEHDNIVPIQNLSWYMLVFEDKDKKYSFVGQLISIDEPEGSDDDIYYTVQCYQSEPLTDKTVFRKCNTIDYVPESGIDSFSHQLLSPECLSNGKVKFPRSLEKFEVNWFQNMLEVNVNLCVLFAYST